MKRSFLFIGLALACSLAFASSTVKFPIKAQEIAPYPGNFSFVLNGKSGVHNDVYYFLECVITNPNDYDVNVRFTFDPLRDCEQHGCGSIDYLNGSYINYNMLNLKPGRNDFKILSLITHAQNPNSKMTFENYDNDGAVVLESCEANILS